VSTTVIVKIDSSVDTSSYLSAGMLDAKASANSDYLFQIINNFGSTVGLQNCTSSPDCDSLNRNKCFGTPNTCGSCLDGYKGVDGESFYFVHSYAARELPGAVNTYATHGEKFLAATEDGALSATQFHPEKSGRAGLALIKNWSKSL
jgi:hypothetical protein